MFARLGDFVTRHWLTVILGWAALAIVLRFVAPDWNAVAHDGNLAYLPSGMTSVEGERLLREAFPQNRAQSQMVVVIARDEAPLTDADKDVAAYLADEFETLADELGIADVWTHDMRVIGEKLKSADGRAVLIALQMRGEFMAVDNIRILNRVVSVLDEARAADEFPAGLQLGVTGSAAVGGDMLASAGESIRNTELTTILVIVVILLVVYRAPLLVVVPLFTITVAVVVGTSVLALLTQLNQIPGMEWWDFKVFTTTRIFIVVILFGSGTDFCLFLIARYREELERRPAAHALSKASPLPGPLPEREGERQPLAAALSGVGEALVASAATTIVGLAMMFFADFGKFRDSGPAIAICLAVTLAACITLAPALLRAAGGYVFWPSKLSALAGQSTSQPAELVRRRSSTRAEPFLTGGFWTQVSHLVVRRPGLLLLASVVLLAPFAAAGLSIDITYDLLNEMRADRPSVAGSRLLRDHFPAGETGPVIVLVDRRDADFRETEGRDEIAELTEEFLKLDGVEAVRSATQPFGHPFRGLGSLLGGGASKVLAANTSRAKDTYVTPVAERNGTVARLDLVLTDEPFSREAAARLSAIESEVLSLRHRDASWREADFYFAGTTSATRDLERVTSSDQILIQQLVVLAVLGVLLVLLRQPLVCVYLIATVLLTYYVTLGATELLFEWLYRGSYAGLDWKVPLFLFVILIAVGEDYNIYLMTRVVEEQERHGPIRGLQIAVARTGGIITSCGIIMAATFVSMATGTLRGMQELGFALSLGVLLDTLVVRPVLVPAFLTLLDRVVWMRAARAAVAGRRLGRATQR
jgi:RND superfamily putative drug exporter